MSVIKIGNRVVQSGDSGYQPRGVKTSSPKRRILKTENEIPDNRQRYIANQAQKAENQAAQDLINQANRRSDVETAMRFAPELVNRSEFTGNKGDGLFGLNINATPTNIPKLREGLSSDEYANYMRGLYSINPSRFETLFPVASGAVFEKLLTPAPFKLLAQAMGDRGSDVLSGIKKIAQDKGIIPKDSLNTDTGTTAFTSQSSPDLSDGGIMDNNLVRPAPSMTQTDFLARPEMNQPPRGLETIFIPTIDPRVGLQQELDRLPENMFPETVTTPRRVTATNPEAAALMQQIMNKQINMVDGRDTVGDLQPMYGINAITMNPEQYILDNPPEIKTGLFNEGGLASINNPEYNLLMNASDFDL